MKIFLPVSSAESVHLTRESEAADPTAVITNERELLNLERANLMRVGLNAKQQVTRIKKQLQARKKALDTREEALDNRQKGLDAREEALDARDTKLEDNERLCHQERLEMDELKTLLGARNEEIFKQQQELMKEKHTIRVGFTKRLKKLLKDDVDNLRGHSADDINRCFRILRISKSIDWLTETIQFTTDVYTELLKSLRAREEAAIAHNRKVWAEQQRHERWRRSIQPKSEQYKRITKALKEKKPELEALEKKITELRETIQQLDQKIIYRKKKLKGLSRK